MTIFFIEEIGNKKIGFYSEKQNILIITLKIWSRYIIDSLTVLLYAIDKPPFIEVDKYVKL